MFGPELRPEFVQRVDGWIDFPSQPLLSASQRRHDVLERRVTDDEHVDVAGGAEFTTGGGAEYKRHQHALAEGRQRLSKQIGQPRSLCEQALKLREDRRLAVRLKIDLLTLNGPEQQSGPRQLLQFPLRSAERGTRGADNLAEVEGLVGMAEQPAENPPARAAEQHCRGIGGAHRNGGTCSHNAYNCTHIRNAVNRPDSFHWERTAGIL